MMKYYKLKELSTASGIAEETLRREVRAGFLKCIRPRASCNAPILIREDAFENWINDHASKRQYGPG